MRGAVKGGAALVEKAAQEAQGGCFVERVHKGGAVTGNHIQVTVSGFYERREKTGSVHPLPFCEYSLRIGEAVYGEVKGFYPAVLGRIHEVYHLDIVLADKAEHVFPGKSFRAFLQESDYLIGVQRNCFVHIECG